MDESSLRLSAYQGDRDSQYALADSCENGVQPDQEQAIFWYRKAALQGHDLAVQKCTALGISFIEEPLDKEAVRKALKCRLYPLNYLGCYKYTVICSNYHGKWILSRHKNRSTWETQGGHIEMGETPLDCAKRELFEESGILDATLYPLCDYWGFNSQRCSNGMVLLAVVHSIGDLPESEMKEVKAFNSLPDELTYPLVTPLLCAKAEELLTIMKKL